MKPRLASYAFPQHILTEQRLAASLTQARIKRIRQSILDLKHPESMIGYFAPWTDAGVIRAGMIDMIFLRDIFIYTIKNTGRLFRNTFYRQFQ